jgi:hypothetical protein
VSLSKPSSEVVEADQRATELEERLVDVVAPLIADREPAVLRKPGQRALDNPPVPPQSLARVDSASGDAWGYAPLSQGLSATREVVSLICVELLGTLPRSVPGRPRGRLIGSMLSTASSRTLESWTFAAVSTTASGMPPRSETTWRFEPAFPLSVGFAPVFAPPFWQGWKPNRVRHAPSRSGQLLQGGRAG